MYFLILKATKMLKNNVFVILIGLSFISFILCQSRNYFDRKCPVNNRKGVRKCKIYIDNNTLNFNDFRVWTSELAESTKVALEVSCGPNGRMFLPWPMKAKGLVKLEVRGCTIEGFTSEFNKTSKLVDELQDFTLDSCVSVMSLDDIFDLIYTPVSQEYDCGQQTIHSSVIRNMTYSFPDLNPKDQSLNTHQEDLLMSSADVLVDKSEQTRYTCSYPNLEYIDMSTSRSRSKLHLRLMTDHSKYPKLRTFLLSDNGYKRIPQELINWRKSFPQLEYMDMSKNSITKLDFLGTSFNRRIRRKRPLVVNLSYNSVKTIPYNIVEYMNGTLPIIVDLTGNPFSCDCNFLRYKKYVMDVVRKYPKFKRLSLIKCYSTRTRRRIKLADYDNYNCLF